LGRPLKRVGKTVGDSPRNFDEGFSRIDPDRANLRLCDVPATTQQRQQPAWISILATANIHTEPDGIFKTGPRTAIHAFFTAGAGSRATVDQQFFRLG
jgi:hypothetical protein